MMVVSGLEHNYVHQLPLRPPVPPYLRSISGIRLICLQVIPNVCLERHTNSHHLNFPFCLCHSGQHSDKHLRLHHYSTNCRLPQFHRFIKFQCIRYR